MEANNHYVDLIGLLRKALSSSANTDDEDAETLHELLNLIHSNEDTGVNPIDPPPTEAISYAPKVINLVNGVATVNYEVIPFASYVFISDSIITASLTISITDTIVTRTSQLTQQSFINITKINTAINANIPIQVFWNGSDWQLLSHLARPFEGIISNNPQSVPITQAVYNALQTESTNRQEQIDNIESNYATNQSLQNHIDSDSERWQVEADAKIQLVAYMKDWVKKQIAGTNPSYNYNTPQIVIGKGGLLNAADASATFTVPANGAIICAASGLLSVATSVLLNGEIVWDAPLLLGLGGDKNPSDEIPVSAGQTIKLSNVLSLGAAISVTYYPVLGI